MFKRISLAILAIILTSAIVLAAPLTAKVTAVEGDRVTVELQGDAESWVKKGRGVKIKDIGTGKIVEVKEKTVTFTTKKASDIKVGAELSLTKGAMLGC